MYKSARVTLTVLAGISGAAHAQQANPCGPNSFNPAACQVAVKSHGFCDGGAWTPQDYQKYPYYYNLYRAYSSAGGVVTPFSAGACRASGGRGGFGAVAAAHRSNPGS